MLVWLYNEQQRKSRDGRICRLLFESVIAKMYNDHALRWILGRSVFSRTCERYQAAFAARNNDSVR